MAAGVFGPKLFKKRRQTAARRVLRVEPIVISVAGHAKIATWTRVCSSALKVLAEPQAAGGD